MLKRFATVALQKALGRQAAVVLLGPRQAGKTTLAREIGDGRPSVYLDLESASDRAKIADPSAFFALHGDELVILDEVHKTPDLFNELRGVIDRDRRAGRRTGRLLMLGSAAIDLLRQSGESLAGRVEYVELSPFTAVEIDDSSKIPTLWLRGGFPDSFLSPDDAYSLAHRRNFVRTYLERDVPLFGPRVAAGALERLWTMVAHSQGGLLNASRLASSMGVSAPTVTAYIDLLVDLLLVRRLPPFHSNLGKRLVKSPKIYIRDSGLTHALLGIETSDDLLGHPVAGPSWEGFVIESVLAASPPGTSASFYRSSGGAEIDLVLETGARHGVWAIEIKRTTAPKLERGFRSALEDVKPTRSFIVYGGDDRFPLGGGVEAIGLKTLVELLKSSF